MKILVNCSINYEFPFNFKEIYKYIDTYSGIYSMNIIIF